MTAGNKLGLLLPVLLLSCFGSLHAQGFRLQAPLDGPTATGFYQVALSSPMAAAARADFSDLRIVAGNDTIPYLIRRYDAAWKPAEFLPYNLLTNHTDDSGRTVLDIGGLPAGGISALSLVMANTAVAREASVSGSNDGRQWYIIAEHLTAGGEGSGGSGTYLQQLSFPHSRYRMLRLTIDNAHGNPLNVLQAGAYGRSNPTGGAWTANPALAITQSDSSNKRSYVLLHGNGRQLAERLSLAVSGPKFYSRAARLYAADSDARQGDAQPVATLTLQPGAPATLTFDALKAGDWRLEIDNGDNPPLRISAAATAYRTPYLVAWLEAGRPYRLLADNPSAPAPQYDLGHFADSIPVQISTLGCGSPAALPAPSPPPVPKAREAQAYWIWPAIGIAVAALGLLTWRLLRDMRHKEGAGED